MNRSAIGYVVTPQGMLPFIARVDFDVDPETGEVRALVDDGSGPRWWPPLSEPPAVPVETEDVLRLDYRRGVLGERGAAFTPVTVDRWNAVAQERPEMTPVDSFEDLAARLASW